MFHNTKIEILQSPDAATIKTIYADVQPYSGTVTFDYGITLEISKRAFCDVDEEINVEPYFRIDDVYYKVLNVKGWSDHLEVFLYRCKRTVV
jgi:hypothetical protein